MAPLYAGPSGATIAEDDLPVALASYTFAREGTTGGRARLALGLSDRLLRRARPLFAEGQERSGLAAVRLAASLSRQHRVALPSLSNDAVAALDAAVSGPAARGEEGATRGLYRFWSMARPQDPRPRGHMEAIERWIVATSQAPSSLLRSGGEAMRRSEELAYLPIEGELPQADAAIARWMQHIAAFQEAARSMTNYGDEVYSAMAGLRTAGLRILVGHLRDGDLEGAVTATEPADIQQFLPDSVRAALVAAASNGGADRYLELIAALMPASKLEHMEDFVHDAIVGTAMAATARFPQDVRLAEVVARGYMLAGAGDAAPAVLAHVLLGTADDPRRPGASELGRALAMTAAAMRDFSDRGDYVAARRAYHAAEPLLLSADQVGDVEPSSAVLDTLMGLVEGDAGRPDQARAMFDRALSKRVIALALAGRARLAARDGDVARARAMVEQALALKERPGDAASQAELTWLAGDLARRQGDLAAARAAYERSLKLLAQLQASGRGAGTQLGLRMVMILARFEGAAAREDAAVKLAEADAGTGASEARARGELTLARMMRPLRGPDLRRAHDVFRSATEGPLPTDYLVELATLARAIERRTGSVIDESVARALSQASTRDDFAGRLAKLAQGALDLPAVLKSSTSGRQRVAAKFVWAINRWATLGMPAAQPDLVEVARGEVLGAVEVELALTLLEPQRAMLPGSPAVP